MTRLNTIRKNNDFEKRLNEKPEDLSLWIDYATFLDKEFNNQDLAIQALERAYFLSPSIHIKLKIGIIYTNKGEIEKGVALFKEVLISKPTTHGFCLLASAYNEIKNYEEAIKACENAIELEPTYEEIYLNLGNAFYGQYKETKDKSKKENALKAFKKAIELDSKYQEAYRELGCLLVDSSDNIDEGINCLIKAININKNDNQTFWATAFLANAYWKKNDYKKAEETYQGFIKKYPDDSISYKLYGDFLAGEDRILEAESIYQKAIEKFPDDPEVSKWRNSG